MVFGFKKMTNILRAEVGNVRLFLQGSKRRYRKWSKNCQPYHIHLHNHVARTTPGARRVKCGGGTTLIPCSSNWLTRRRQLGASPEMLRPRKPAGQRGYCNFIALILNWQCQYIPFTAVSLDLIFSVLTPANNNFRSEYQDDNYVLYTLIPRRRLLKLVKVEIKSNQITE